MDRHHQSHDDRRGPAPANLGKVYSVQSADPIDVLKDSETRVLIGRLLGVSAEALAIDFLSEPRTVAIGDHEVRYVVSKSHSNGLFSCVEMSHPEGFAPPRHQHSTEDELFVVLEGRYTYQVGEVLQELSTGNFIHGPRGVPHGFRSCASNSRALLFSAPAGFEEYFADVSALPSDGFREALLALNQRYGVEFLGGPIAGNSRFWDEPST